MLLFEGYAAGPHHNVGGGGSNFLCLHENPQWKTYREGDTSSTGSIHGVEYQFINITLSSLQATTAVIHSLTIRLRVWCATWEVVQQSSWFQHEHSVRTAGPWSMVDIWSQKTCTLIENEAATFAGTRYRKLQLVHKIKTNQLSTLLKSSVEHYHVRCTMTAGN